MPCVSSFHDTILNEFAIGEDINGELLFRLTGFGSFLFHALYIYANVALRLQEKFPSLRFSFARALSDGARALSPSAAFS